ncbi:chemotaxis protein MotB [Humidesulfovibrio mexicanus]|uniref:Chemotaxis protein MotB n=1 Tax=Humidesulfovibrio mexicanus TaxID=147047 RepID=A0A239CLW9_9BACT|nr:flagellar motor protein MotB [Humidesulfovibrio mexicanus]SNS20343.1 chemotaxis protein MotB [Humidesulfovibrio mexicanus]
MAENKPIIVKKVKKGHGGAHGGAWKVAYADFMTAMMAFFLLMWLLSMVVPEKRAGVEQYFKEFSLFDKQSSLDVRQGGAMIPDQDKPPVPQRDQLTEAAEHGKQPAVQPERLKSSMQDALNLNLPDVKDQITVDVTEAGVRIQIGYNEDDPLFAKGSPELTAKGRKAVQFIGSQLKDLPNKVEVEGHTDAVNYSGGKYTNWELSTQRASTARYALEQGGLPEDRLARVSGFAATQPLYPDNPTDPRNRRISILVRNYVPPQEGDGLAERIGAEKARAKEPNIAEEVNATIERMLSVEGRQPVAKPEEQTPSRPIITLKGVKQ